MTKSTKHRRKRKRAAPQEHPSPAIWKPSRKQVLIALLALAALSSVALSRLNTKEVVTEESPEILEMKKQMLEQFMQRQSGTPGGDAAIAPEP